MSALSEHTTLGKYEILRRLAVGGMAEIYLARTQSVEGFEKHVVLKRILPEFARDTRFVEMFLNEARLAAMLHHQNVAQVFDIDETDGTYFIAMEYLHGEDVRVLLKLLKRFGQKLPISHGLTIAAGACAGLHYAHERKDRDGSPMGIVHRDVSPSNICVTYDGGVKIVDFGIAKAVSNSETQSGALKGKVSYMAPEQLSDGRIDRRTDVFAMGIVLWEMLTTSRLFGGRTDYLVMQRVMEKEIAPPSSRNPEIPKALDAIVMRCLQRDPEMRYQTVQKLLLDVEDVAEGCGWRLSSTQLARYLTTTFGERVEPWLPGSDLLEPGEGNTRSGVVVPGAKSAIEAARVGANAMERAAILGTQEDSEDWPALQLDIAPTTLHPGRGNSAGALPLLAPEREPEPGPVLGKDAPGRAGGVRRRLLMAAAVLAVVVIAIFTFYENDEPTRETTSTAPQPASSPTRAMTPANDTETNPSTTPELPAAAPTPPPETKFPETESEGADVEEKAAAKPHTPKMQPKRTRRHKASPDTASNPIVPEETATPVKNPPKPSFDPPTSFDPPE